MIGSCPKKLYWEWGRCRSSSTLHSSDSLWRWTGEPPFKEGVLGLMCVRRNHQWRRPEVQSCKRGEDLNAKWHHGISLLLGVGALRLATWHPGLPPKEITCSVHVGEREGSGLLQWKLRGGIYLLQVTCHLGLGKAPMLSWCPGTFCVWGFKSNRHRVWHRFVTGTELTVDSSVIARSADRLWPCSSPAASLGFWPLAAWFSHLLIENRNM